MGKGMFNFDSTRSTKEQDFSRGANFDKKERSFRLRPEPSKYLFATKLITGGLFIAGLAYGSYVIANSGTKLAEKYTDRISQYLIDEE